MYSSIRRMFAALGLLCVFTASDVSAVEPFAATPQEEAMCSALVYGGLDRDARMRIEGQERWLHTHHYCDCIRFRYRALKNLGDRNAVNYNLAVAIGGCDYVLKAVPRDYFLRAKIHVDKGRALKLRGDRSAALQEFMAAIQVDPKEVPAYLELSQLQRDSGQVRQALETLTDGLRHNPVAKVLQKSYLELGGKEPFPEPIQRQSEREPPQAEPTDSPKEVASGTAMKSPASGAKEPVGAESALASPDESLQVPGRSCRFCPPEDVLQRWGDSFLPKSEMGATKDEAK